MISCLKKALQPSVNNLSLTFITPDSYDTLMIPSKMSSVFHGEKLVVYGVLKRKLPETCDTKCKAVLAGNIAGEPFEDEIPFDVPPPTGHKGDTLLHQLAAKRLIQEWQDDGPDKHKDDMIALSIDSSVVSKFTVFVAVDEQQSVPVAGAMTNWMLSSSM